jgi:predicted Zn-dependent protease with MMP-like domain
MNRAIRGQPDILIHEIGHHSAYSDGLHEQIEFGEE